MKIGGVTKLSTIDFPNELSYIIFLKGCDFRCRYCHNKDLPKSPDIPYTDILSELEQRKSFNTAVVFSGGEATLQLEEAHLRPLKSLGYKIGLHTNLNSPTRLQSLLELKLLDWVGADVKTSLDNRYDILSGVKDSYVNVKKSLSLLKESGINYELRLTWDKGIIDEEQIKELETTLILSGHPKLKLQRCNQN
jgi:pyruvate formate lyase activating enzyme